MNELFTSATSNQIRIETDQQAQNIGFISDGDWARYDNVDLTDIVSFSARIASKKTGDKTITMHLDDNGSPGEAIGTVTYSGDTGGWHSYVDADRVALSQEVSGTQSIFFVFTGAFNIDFFTLHIEDPTLSISNDDIDNDAIHICLLYTSPSPRDKRQSRMPSSA